MLIKAYAKINLTLDVVGLRMDGYHNISSVMQEISLCDDINIAIKKIKDDNKISISIKKSDLPTDEKNTCYRAAEIFLKEYQIKNTLIKIEIKKRIPSQTGLGGGSSDAAATLKALNILFKINAPVEKLQELGLKIGADVPFFIKGGTQLAEGIGEQLTTISIPHKPYYIIVIPEEKASTQEIYKALDIMLSERMITSPDYKTKKFINALSLGKQPFEHIGNMLSQVTEKEIPKIAYIREKLEVLGARACMSGSGSAVYGIFTSYAAAVDALNKLKKDAQSITICVAN